jgi:hypothetical protein
MEGGPESREELQVPRKKTNLRGSSFSAKSRRLKKPKPAAPRGGTGVGTPWGDDSNSSQRSAEGSLQTGSLWRLTQREVAPAFC